MEAPGAAASPAVRRGPSLSTRWLVFTLLHLALVVSYALRGLMSVAVIGIAAEFGFNNTDLGQVNASFFAGYLLTQFVGGLLATRLGGHPVLLAGILLPSLLTLLTPPLAGRLSTLCAMRFLTGLFEGVAYPTVHALVAQWSPERERSSAVGWVWSGAYLGTGATLPLAGLLAGWGGWRSIFAVFGGAGVVWSVAWAALATSSPEKHRSIPPAERDHIIATRGTGGATMTTTLGSVPWRLLLTHEAVAAVIVAHTAHNFHFYLLLVWMPVYLHQILGFSLEDAATASLFPFLACFVGSLVSGRLGDGLIARGVPVVRVRKGMQVVAEALPALALAVVGSFSSGPPVVGLLTVAVGLSGFCSAGYAPNHLDIAPQYAGLLMGVGNTVASLPGVVAPLLVGALVAPPHNDAEHWRIAFSIAAAVALFGCAVFLRCGRGDMLPELRASPGDAPAGVGKGAGPAGGVVDNDEEDERAALTGGAPQQADAVFTIVEEEGGDDDEEDEKEVVVEEDEQTAR
jgi:MFS family permease